MPIAIVGAVRDVEVEVVDGAGIVGGADVGMPFSSRERTSKPMVVGRRVGRHAGDGDLALLALEESVRGDDVPVEEVVDPERADCADDGEGVHCCFELWKGVSETEGRISWIRMYVVVDGDDLKVSGRGCRCGRGCC